MSEKEDQILEERAAVAQPTREELRRAALSQVVRQILSTRRAKAKVVAVDCDNTLWGGVVGEVGLNGITLGPDGAGRGFQLFQQYLKRLRDRGLLLVIVSRNEESDVRAVFEKHPEMVLSLDDIAAMIEAPFEETFRLWQDRPAPVLQLSDDLGRHLAVVDEGLRAIRERLGTELRKGLLEAYSERGFDFSRIEKRVSERLTDAIVLRNSTRS